MTKRITIIKVLSFLTFLGAVLGPTRAGMPGVSQDALVSHVRFLASDALEGRAAGERGDDVAEAYVRANFEQAGLKVLPGMNDYYQEFTVPRSRLDREKTYLAVENGSTSYYYYDGGKVFFSLRLHDDTTVRARVVFVGFGITAPEYQYDDYAGMKVKGKIVIVLNHEPGEKTQSEKFRGRKPTKYSSPMMKAGMAKSHGAAGIIIVNDAANGHEDLDVTLPRRYGDLLDKPFLGFADDDAAIPIFFATKSVVEALLSGTGVDLLKLQKKIDERMKPASRTIPDRFVTMNVRLAGVEERKLDNVIGYIEGKDPLLRDEFIIIAAHHDHLGIGSAGEIFHGADDNASGSAGLLETARIMVSRDVGRSLLFVSFCGEEEGSLGAKYFLQHMPVGSAKVMINLDMIGRNNMNEKENENMFIVFTSAQTPFLAELVKAEADTQKADVRVAPYLHFHGASDHSVFHKAEIPVIFYFSGFHEDYHSVGDTADKIIPAKMAEIVRHVCGILPVLAQRKVDDLMFDRAITEEPAKDDFEKPY